MPSNRFAPAALGAAATALLVTCCLSGFASAAAREVGLGKVLSTKDSGQIFGFDIDQNGEDGVLASSQTIDGQGDVLTSVETFDQNSGKITKSFARYSGMRNDYGVDGIFAGDVALVTHFITPAGQTGALRRYDVMNPVTAQAFTGVWTPPLEDIDIQQLAENQTTSTSVLPALY